MGICESLYVYFYHLRRARTILDLEFCDLHYKCSSSDPPSSLRVISHVSGAANYRSS